MGWMALRSAAPCALTRASQAPAWDETSCDGLPGSPARSESRHRCPLWSRHAPRAPGPRPGPGARLRSLFHRGGHLEDVYVLVAFDLHRRAFLEQFEAVLAREFFLLAVDGDAEFG